MSMMRFNSEQFAKEQAKKFDLCYGWSCLGSAWYVGTSEQLRIIGVVEVELREIVSGKQNREIPTVGKSKLQAIYGLNAFKRGFGKSEK